MSFFGPGNHALYNNHNKHEKTIHSLNQAKVVETSEKTIIQTKTEIKLDY